MEKEAAAFFNLAEQLFQQGRPEEALARVRSGLNLAPESPLGLQLEERALEELTGDLAEALEKGAGLAEEGLLREADSVFARILELDPANEQARDAKVKTGHRLNEKASEFAARGNLALEDGRLPAAREAFDTALQFVPELREAKEGLARIDVLLTAMISEEVQWGRRARSAGQLHQAHEHFANALRLREDSDLRVELEAIERHIAEALFSLIDAAWAALEKNDFRRAVSFFEKALARSPANPDVLQGLAELEVRSAALVEGELAAAEEDLATWNYPRALSRYRHILEIDPASNKARAGLDHVLKAVEEDLVRLLAAGEEALAGGLFGEAEIFFREALNLDPCRLEARTALRRLEQRNGFEIAQTDEQRLYLRGIELYTLGKYKEAVTAWEEVLALSPRHEKAILNIEKARRKLRQVQEEKGEANAGQTSAGWAGRRTDPVQPGSIPFTGLSAAAGKACP
jgi:tetratricopeptide (TPR) repeat protein